MAEIESSDDKELSMDERIEVFVALGMTPEYARFVIAMEDGEITGDVVMLDGNGNEIKQP